MRTPFMPEHAKALTVLLLTIRPDWSREYTFDAVTRMRLIDDNLERICRVAVNSALNPKIRKPDVLAMNGEHWKARTDDAPAEPERTKHCIKCGEFHKPNDCSGPVVIHRSQRPEGAWKAEYLKVKRPSKVINRAAEAARRVENVELPSEERS